MQCSNCGKTIDSADTFCAYCGAPIGRTYRWPGSRVLPAIGLASLAIVSVGVCVLAIALRSYTSVPTTVANPPPSQQVAAPDQSAATLTPTMVRPASPTAPVAGAFFCTDRLGCVTIGPNEPVHIAYIFATSGDDANLGLDTVYGAELAVRDAGGRLLGHSIKFDGQDSGCSPDAGRAAAVRIAQDKTVVAVIGTSCSGEAREAAPIILTQAGISALISPSSTAPDLTDPASHVAGYFRTAHNDIVQAALAADFVSRQLKLTRVSTIHDGSVYAQEMAGIFGDTFRRNGGIITTQGVVNVGDKDVKPLLTRIAATKPDLIYYPIFLAEGGLVCSQIRTVPGLERTLMMGADGIFSPDFLRSCGKNVVGMFMTAPNWSAFGGAYHALVQRYLTVYNVKGTLGPFHAHSYDAMNMVLKALEKPGVVVRDADGTLHVLKQALRDAIAATDMQGFTGHIKCNPNGDCADPKIAVYEVTADNFRKLEMPRDPVWLPDRPG